MCCVGVFCSDGRWACGTRVLCRVAWGCRRAVCRVWGLWWETALNLCPASSVWREDLQNCRPVTRWPVHRPGRRRSGSRWVIRQILTDINQIAYHCKNYKLVHGNKLGQNKIIPHTAIACNILMQHFMPHSSGLKTHQKRCIKICVAQYWEKCTSHYLDFLIYIYCDVKKYRHFH